MVSLGGVQYLPSGVRRFRAGERAEATATTSAAISGLLLRTHFRPAGMPVGNRAPQTHTLSKRRLSLLGPDVVLPHMAQRMWTTPWRLGLLFSKRPPHCAHTWGINW